MTSSIYCKLLNVENVLVLSLSLCIVVISVGVVVFLFVNNVVLLMMDVKIILKKCF